MHLLSNDPASCEGTPKRCDEGIYLTAGLGFGGWCPAEACLLCPTTLNSSSSLQMEMWLNGDPEVPNNLPSIYSYTSSRTSKSKQQMSCTHSNLFPHTPTHTASISPTDIVSQQPAHLSHKPLYFSIAQACYPSIASWAGRRDAIMPQAIRDTVICHK